MGRDGDEVEIGMLGGSRGLLIRTCARLVISSSDGSGTANLHLDPLSSNLHRLEITNISAPGSGDTPRVSGTYSIEISASMYVTSANSLLVSH